MAALIVGKVFNKAVVFGQTQLLRDVQSHTILNKSVSSLF
jgi:hypothetical protein